MICALFRSRTGGLHLIGQLLNLPFLVIIESGDKAWCPLVIPADYRGLVGVGVGGEPIRFWRGGAGHSVGVFLGHVPLGEAATLGTLPPVLVDG